MDMYLALARATEGPVLELAVGSGRIAVPLAVAGHGVTGVDVDPRCSSALARPGWRRNRWPAVAHLTCSRRTSRILI